MSLDTKLGDKASTIDEMFNDKTLTASEAYDFFMREKEENQD
ncbi:hypothetical protein [Vibrio neptunius]|nr:hypothetical protein [Vibrio neptunius]